MSSDNDKPEVDSKEQVVRDKEVQDFLSIKENGLSFEFFPCCSRVLDVRDVSS